MMLSINRSTTELKTESFNVMCGVGWAIISWLIILNAIGCSINMQRTLIGGLLLLMHVFSRPAGRTLAIKLTIWAAITHLSYSFFHFFFFFFFFFVVGVFV
jgi:hypothetical protein